MIIQIDTDKVYTVTEYARQLSTKKRKVFTAQVYRMIDAKELPTIEVRGVKLINKTGQTT